MSFVNVTMRSRWRKENVISGYAVIWLKKHNKNLCAILNAVVGGQSGRVSFRLYLPESNYWMHDKIREYITRNEEKILEYMERSLDMSRSYEFSYEIERDRLEI